MTEEATRALERSRAVRRGHRGVVTKLVHEAEGILRDETMDSEQRSRLSVIKQQLEGKLKLLNDMDRDILNRCEVDTIETEIDESELVIAKIISCNQQIDKAAASSPSSAAVPSRVTPTVQPAKPRLPKLLLPKFKGDVKHWTAFWDSFQSAVHNNDDIPKVDKFNYLNSLLEGAAFKTIQGLTLSEANYDAAVSMLKERFGNPQQIISAHMEGLLKVANCTGDRPTSLRAVYDKIMVHIRGLEALGVTAEQYGSLLIPVIMTKFPSDIRLRIARETGREAWKIQPLLDMIKKEVEAREASEGAVVSTNRPNGPVPRNPPIPSASSLVTNSSNYKPKCVYCDDEHYSASCTKVTSVTDRKGILLKTGRCFNCLKTRHKSRDCDSTRTCRHCHQRHHQSICGHLSAHPDPEKTSSNVTTSTATRAKVGKKVVLLQTAQVTAIGESTQLPVRVLLDSGSQLSYITTNLRERLRLKSIQREKLSVNTFGNSSFNVRSCDVVRFYICKPGSSDRIEIIAYTSPVICTPLPKLVDVCQYEHLHGLELADNDPEEQSPIDILIGSDCYWTIVTGQTIIGDQGPVAIDSKLGWLLSGPLDCHNRAVSTHSYMIVHGNLIESPMEENDDPLASTLRHFWDVESLGIIEEKSDSHSLTFLPMITFSDNQYKVGLPWKESHPDVPDHYNVCLNRLRLLHRRLLKDPELLQEYNCTIREQLSQGIIELVPQDCSQSRFHYLPHHGVIRQDKQTTKLRIVYNGSARSKADGASLNDCLETGPNLIPKLFDILIKFRWHLVTVTADIEKAFLMIGILPGDRDMLRFLWVKDPTNVESDVLQLRFTRLVFGLRPSPAILGTVISHHLDRYQSDQPELIQFIKDSFYVDDLICGGDTVEEAFNIYQVAKEALAAGGFHLRKWNSNSQELRNKMLPESDLSNQVVSDSNQAEQIAHLIDCSNTRMDDQPQDKLLGISYNSCHDEFTFCFSDLMNQLQKYPASRRSLLRVTASVFDPLGLLSPFVIRLKILFQVLCCRGVEWDSPLEGKHLKQWNSLTAEFNILNQVRVPRCYFCKESKPVIREIHGYSDASEQAYAAVLYLRTIGCDGTVITRLIASKTRVAPVKRQSIPRLELLGALILTRLVNTVVKCCPQRLKVICWVDSTSTLFWIRNDRPWKQYISRRVNEIRSSFAINQWRYCPGTANPADLPSRGLDAHQLLGCTMWWEGPSFLKLGEESWPILQEVKPSDVIFAELTKSERSETHVLTSIGGQATFNMDNVIDCQRFSEFKLLLRVTAHVLRFVEIVKSSPLCVLDLIHGHGQLEARELDRAETLWIRSIQFQAFEKEIRFLENCNLSKPPYIDQFCLFLDEQHVLRCKGRICNSTLSDSAKKPLLLPAKHWFVSLLIMETHKRVKHGGINITLTTLREQYWIVKGRQVVKGILRKCVVCKKLEGPPYCSSRPPDLPDCRVSEDPPFAHTGLDFAGPLYYLESKDDSNSSKSYICLFTCASTRAVHLELTRGLNVENFLLAFRKFAARRGLPVTILSDNAKTFKSASKEIRTISRSSDVFQYLSNQRTSWKFITAKAPWWGGFWERMVQLVKRSLRKVVGKTTLTFDELNTLLIEIEAIINSRPLTFVYDDCEGISYALTPSHLLYGNRLAITPSASHHEVVSTNKTLTRRAKNHQRILNQLVSRWRKEYLLSLREYRGVQLKHQGPSIKVGDVVILKDENTVRNFWKLAKVIELLEGADGIPRAALINVATTNGPPKILRRSIRHLIPIEVSETNEAASIDSNSSREGSHDNSNDEHNDHEDVPVPEGRDPSALSRPRRKAAVSGERTRRTWTELK